MAEARSDVPEELEKAHETKVLQEEAAKDAIENQISRGELFLSAIGYISFLCILPLVLLQDSKYAQHHGKQALVLAVFLYFMDILNIFPARFAFLYSVIKIIIVIYCLIMAFKGREFKLPFVYDISQRFSINIKGEKATVGAPPSVQTPS